MAASHTLSHPFVIPQISKLGVLTLYGYGIRVTMQAGHLQIEDGIAEDRYKFRLPRVNHRLKRLVCIGDDGFITLAALRWLSEVGASFVMLDRLGKVQVITGPTSPSETRLRRAQALALTNDAGLHIARELISVKLLGQETLIREKLHSRDAADSIALLRNRLPDANNLNAVRGISRTTRTARSRQVSAIAEGVHKMPTLIESAQVAPEPEPNDPCSNSLKRNPIKLPCRPADNIRYVVMSNSLAIEPNYLI